MLSDVTPSLDGVVDGWAQAVRYDGGRLLVLGPAGTGKTCLIQARFGRLVHDGRRPERIAVLTPTRARADALRDRLEHDLEDGYDELFVLTPVELAALIVGVDVHDEVLGAGDRLAMLIDRIDELSLHEHDFGGSANALLAGFVRTIDRCKAELIDAEQYAAWAATIEDSEREREFAELYRAHERMLADAGARDEGNLMRDALRLVRPGRFEHVLADDVQELDLAAARLVQAVGGTTLTAAGDPAAALRRFRGAGTATINSFHQGEPQVVQLERSWRCPEQLLGAGRALLGELAGEGTGPGGEVAFWRCATERAQAQAVAAEVERLIAREHVSAGQIAIIVPSATRDGQAVAVALEERAVSYRLIGEAAFFQRAEIRDVLAWLRLLADPTDAPAVVRALARAPIELRSVDVARCTQIARRRKLDMVAALAAATESPQVPPEARERILVFLKLYRSAIAAIDTTRPDLYVHRLIERLGLRRAQLFAAQADVVERLRALSRLSELAAAYVRRSPQATAREFARSIAAVADVGLREQEEPQFGGAGAAVQVLALGAAGGLEADHVYVVGLCGGVRGVAEPEPIADALLHEQLPADDEDGRGRMLRQALYVAVTRARARVVLAYPAASDRGGTLSPLGLVEDVRLALAASWDDREEELFGPAETLHSTYRLLRDELLEGTMRAGGRLAELRFDTDLDVAHAVVRYLELLKLAALIARPEGQSTAEALHDVNARILQAVTAEEREIFTSSALDDYLLDVERDTRRRAQAIAARDEPSLQAFLPVRGDGVVLSASDIDTYRTCPLKYKFARVFRIPQEPTIHQRFGIAVHQVLERYHAGDSGSLAELLGLLDAAWRRGGFGDSEEERQLRGKATAALTRYFERAQDANTEPVWFERQFTFKLGPHLLRGRVDRVDRLPGGEYELIDYKTGRPKTPAQLVDDVQLSLYAVGAREAWSLEASRQAYYYLLDDEKVAVPAGDGDRSEWVLAVATEVAEGIMSQGFEPTPSYAACSICDYRLVCPAAER
jgi:DNA helicase-2/ATP-dependent DNA helicase PcrA